MQRIFFTTAILFFSITTYAQSFKWINGGGSIQSPQYLTDWEQVAGMCTDSNKNIYAISVIYTLNLTADTFHVNEGHYPYIRSILLTSYRCDGTMRWSRLFEGAGDSYIGGIAYDGGGDIYFSGDLNGIGYPKYLASDTGTTAYDNQSTFTAKMDTSGNLSWIKFATPNTMAAVYKSFAQNLAVDGNGNVHNYAYVKTGVQLSSTIVSQKGLYDFKYDNAGVLLGINRLNIDSNYIYMISPVIMKGSNKLIAEVYQDYSTGTTHYIGMFTPAGDLLWKDTLNYASYATSICYDGANGIYAAGSANADNFVIQGNVLTNTLEPNADMSVVLKADTLGNINWTYKVEHSIVGRLTSLGLLPGGKLIAGGYTGATTRHDSTTFVIPPNQGVPYYTVLDTSGTMITLDYLHTDQLYNFFTSIAIDKSGNAYLGGVIEDSVLAPNGLYYKSRGGNSDFFIAKYGYDCDCTAPVSNFTSVNTSANTIQFTFSGIITDIDSIVWNFGDGQMQTITGNYTATISHTYATNGQYVATATVYNSCGSDSHSQTYALGISSINLSTDITVYPNPATDYLTIEGALGASVTITNLLGQQVISLQINSSRQRVSLNDLATGLYVLSIRCKDGTNTITKISKQ